MGDTIELVINEFERARKNSGYWLTVPEPAETTGASGEDVQNIVYQIPGDAGL